MLVLKKGCVDILIKVIVTNKSVLILVIEYELGKELGSDF